jgi:hypothetical protein
MDELMDGLKRAPRLPTNLNAPMPCPLYAPFGTMSLVKFFAHSVLSCPCGAPTSGVPQQPNEKSLNAALLTSYRYVREAPSAVPIAQEAVNIRFIVSFSSIQIQYGDGSPWGYLSEQA